MVLTIASGNFRNLKFSISQYKAVAAICLIFGVFLAGMVYTEHLDLGWKVLKHQHRFLILPLLFLVNTAWLRRYFREYLLAFVLATTLAGILVIVFYLLPEAWVRDLANSTSLMLPYPKNADRSAFGLYTPFISRIQFSSLTAIAILSALYLFVCNYSRKLLFIAIPILLFTMLILGGRGGQVALFVSLLVYFTALGVRLLWPELKNRWGKVTTATVLVTTGLLLFVGLPYLSFQLLPPLQNRLAQTRWEIDLLQNGNYKQFDYMNFTTFRRLASWQNMWQIVKENPILGTGTGDYLPELEKIYAQNNPGLEVNEHNQYLQIWGMNGIFGLLLFLGVMAYWFHSVRNYGQLTLFALAFLVFYIVNMLPDTVLFTTVDSMAFCTFMALIGLQVRPATDKLHA